MKQPTKCDILKTVVFKSKPIHESYLDKLQEKIGGHKKSDNSNPKIRQVPSSDFVDRKWFVKTLKSQLMICPVCNDVIDNPSIDREDNDVGHSKKNCRIVCEKCNKARKDTPFEYQPSCE